MAHNLLHSEVVFVLIFVAVFVYLFVCLFVFAQDSVHMGFILSRSQESTCLNLTSAKEVQKVNMGALLKL